MEFSHAFSPSRAFKHGYEALKLAPAPLFVGALIMSFTEGGGGGNNFSNLGDLAGDDGGYNSGYDFDWDGGGSDWNYRLQIMAEQFGAGDLLQAAGGLPGGLSGLARGELEPALLGGILVGAVCLMGLMLIFAGVRAWVHVGYIRLHEEVIIEGDGSFGTLFGGGDRFVDMLLWKLLKMGIGFGVALASMLPGGIVLGAGAAMDSEPLIMGGVVLMMLIWLPVAIYVGLGMMLGEHVLVLENKGVMDTLGRAWSLADGNRVTIFVFAFMAGLAQFAAAIVGLMMCCVGVIITSPGCRALVDVGWTESFLFHTRGEEEAAKWRVPEVAGGLY